MPAQGAGIFLYHFYEKLTGLGCAKGLYIVILSYCYQEMPEGKRQQAKVAELVDALALGASGVTRESSSLSFRTIGMEIFKL